MRGKLSEKLILTLALSALLAELLNVSKSCFENSKILSAFSTVSCITIIGIVWAYFVIIKDKKKYEDKIETTKARNKLVDFEKIYGELVKEHREYLERKRKVQRDRRVLKYIALAALGVATVGCVYSASVGQFEYAIDLMPTLIIAGPLLVAASATEKEREMEYKAAYKLRVISSLLKNINPNLNYKDTSIEDEALMLEYDIANFGLAAHTKATCLDKIEGTLNDKSVELLELKLESELENSNKKITSLNVFNGWFAKAETKKAWDFKLKISSVGISERAAIYERGTRKIKLDNHEITEKYIVNTNDKMLANRVLTAEIIEYFLKLKEKYGVVFDMFINGGDIYFLFYTGDMFEPDVLTDSMKKELLLSDYSMIKMIIELMQKMITVVEDIQL